MGVSHVGDNGTQDVNVVSPYPQVVTVDPDGVYNFMSTESFTNGSVSGSDLPPGTQSMHIAFGSIPYPNWATFNYGFAIDTLSFTPTNSLTVYANTAIIIPTFGNRVKYGMANISSGSVPATISTSAAPVRRAISASGEMERFYVHSVPSGQTLPGYSGMAKFAGRKIRVSWLIESDAEMSNMEIVVTMVGEDFTTERNSIVKIVHDEDMTISIDKKSASLVFETYVPFNAASLSFFGFSNRPQGNLTINSLIQVID